MNEALGSAKPMDSMWTKWLPWSRRRLPPEGEEEAVIEMADSKYTDLKGRFRHALTDWHPGSGVCIEFEFYLSLLESYSDLFLSGFLCQDFKQSDNAIKRDGSRVEFLELLAVLVEALASSTQVLTLESLRVDLLPRSQLLRSLRDDFTAYTILFCILGWLSMIYTPSLQESNESILAIEAVDSTGRSLQTNIYQQKQINLRGGKTARQPLHNILAPCGILAPRPRPQPLPPNRQQDVFLEQIVVSYLNYQTLRDVAGVKLVFVNCISLHLDFDEKSRELRIFRFPSLCKLLCHSSELLGQDDQVSFPRFLSRWLYNDPRPSASQTSQNQFETGHSQASDMYREVLLSYRLIFGHNKSSWKAWRNFYKARNVPPGIEDPLLRRLCGKDCRYETTYEEIKAPDVAAQYSASEDFPFWGARLLKIQQFVVNKNPSDLKTLWNDRRDLLRFYTFWAVVVVGAMSLILSVIQNIEGGIQVAYAAKANRGFEN